MRSRPPPRAPRPGRRSPGSRGLRSRASPSRASANTSRAVVAASGLPRRESSTGGELPARLRVARRRDGGREPLHAPLVVREGARRPRPTSPSAARASRGRAPGPRGSPSPRRTAPCAIASTASGIRSSSGPCSTSAFSEPARHALRIASTPSRPRPWSRQPCVFGLRSARCSTLSIRSCSLSCGSPTRKSSLPPTASASVLNAKRSSFVPCGVATKAEAAPASLSAAATRSSAAATLTPSQPAAAADARARDALGDADLLVERAARVAQPRLVDVGVAPRPQPLHLAVALVDEDVAAGRAARADRLVLLQEPDPHLEAEVVGQQRAHRADVGQVAGVVVLDRAAVEGRDLGVVAAVHELQRVRARHLVLEAQAARAQHAALGVEHDRPEVHHLALAGPSPRARPSSRRGRSACSCPAGSTRRPGRRRGSRSGG